MAAAAEMAGEGDPSSVPGEFERSHPIAARISQDRPRPAHEIVEAAKPRHPRRPGKHQMIGVGEDDTAPVSHTVRPSFHRRRRPHRHEGGGADSAAHRDRAGARGPVGRGDGEAKREGTGMAPGYQSALQSGRRRVGGRRRWWSGLERCRSPKATIGHNRGQSLFPRAAVDVALLPPSDATRSAVEGHCPLSHARGGRRRECHRRCIIPTRPPPPKSGTDRLLESVTSARQQQVARRRNRSGNSDRVGIGALHHVEPPPRPA